MNVGHRAKRLGGLGICLALFSLLATGCVYLRFLDLKKQLGAFSENLEIRYDQATTFVLKRPVLQSKDIVWMMRGEPTSRKGGDLDRWIYWLAKEYPAEEREPGDFDIKIGFVFTDDRLAEVWFPLRFQEIMNEDAMERMFENVHFSEEDKREMATKWAWYTGPPDFGREESFLRILGEPYVRSETETTTVFTYRYNIKNATRKKKPERDDHSLVFVFSKEDARLIHADVNMGRMDVTVDTDKGVKIKL